MVLTSRVEGKIPRGRPRQRREDKELHTFLASSRLDNVESEKLLCVIIQNDNRYILSNFDYCLSIWGSCGINNTKCLDRLLRKSTRIILNRPIDVEPASMYCQLKLFPLECRYRLRMSTTLMYKALNHLTPRYITNLVN